MSNCYLPSSHSCCHPNKGHTSILVISQYKMPSLVCLGWLYNPTVGSWIMLQIVVCNFIFDKLYWIGGLQPGLSGEPKRQFHPSIHPGGAVRFNAHLAFFGCDDFQTYQWSSLLLLTKLSQLFHIQNWTVPLKNTWCAQHSNKISFNFLVSPYWPFFPTIGSLISITSNL